MIQTLRRYIRENKILILIKYNIIIEFINIINISFYWVNFWDQNTHNSYKLTQLCQ